MRKSRGIWKTVAALAVTLLGTRLAHAGDAERQRADELFRSGRTLVKTGQIEQACPLFAESLTLDPAPGTRLSYADCEDRLGHLAHAYVLYTELHDSLVGGDPRRAFAGERATALESRIAFLRMPSTDQIQRARVDGAAWLNLAALWPVDAGSHKVSIEKTNGTESELAIVVTAGEKKLLDLSAPQTFAVRVTSSATPRGRSSTPALVLAGIGIATLAAGVITGIVVASDASTYKEGCQSNGCNAAALEAADRGRTLRWVSPIALGVGGIATAVGIVLFATSDHRAAVTARAGLGTVQLIGRF